MLHLLLQADPDPPMSFEDMLSYLGGICLIGAFLWLIIRSATKR
jgi:hypothetical protein